MPGVPLQCIQRELGTFAMTRRGLDRLQRVSFFAPGPQPEQLENVGPETAGLFSNPSGSTELGSRMELNSINEQSYFVEKHESSNKEIIS
jgi:hypothetical protein